MNQDQNSAASKRNIPDNEFLFELSSFLQQAKGFEELFKQVKEELSPSCKTSLISTNLSESRFPWPGKMSYLAIRSPNSGALVGVTTNMQIIYMPEKGLGISFKFDLVLPFLIGISLPPDVEPTEEQWALADVTTKSEIEQVNDLVKNLLLSVVREVFPGEGHTEICVMSTGGQRNYTNSFGEHMPAASCLEGTFVFFPDYTAEEKMAVESIYQASSTSLLMEKMRSRMPNQDSDGDHGAPTLQ